MVGRGYFKYFFIKTHVVDIRGLFGIANTGSFLFRKVCFHQVVTYNMTKIICHMMDVAFVTGVTLERWSSNFMEKWHKLALWSISLHYFYTTIK